MGSDGGLGLAIFFVGREVIFSKCLIEKMNQSVRQLRGAVLTLCLTSDVRYEIMKNEDEPSGLGGWLIFPMLGLIISPFIIGAMLVTTFIPIFSEGYWSILTNPESEAYHVLWAPLLAFEIIGNLVFLVAPVILLVLFFQKHYRFPILIIIYLATNLVFIGIDFVAVHLFLGTADGSDPESIKELIKTLIGAVVWIPYFKNSIRVKNTFIKGLI